MHMAWTQTTIDSAELRRRLASPADQDAWRCVNERYAPLIGQFARRSGLGLEDADDVCQETLAAFADAMRAARFDGERGRLRDYLFGIAHNKVVDALGMRSGREVSVTASDSATDFFSRIPGPDELKALWDAEWARAVRKQCLREAKAHFSSSTYRMYYARVIEGRDSASVAEEVGRTVAAVDMATHHVRKFLRRVFPTIAEAF